MGPHAQPRGAALRRTLQRRRRCLVAPAGGALTRLILQGTHLTFQISDRAALATLEGALAAKPRATEPQTHARPRAADVDDALTRAAGANYDLGNTRTGVKAGATASIKSASKQFFQQKDKETEIKAVQFEKVSGYNMRGLAAPVARASLER